MRRGRSFKAAVTACGKVQRWEKKKLGVFQGLQGGQWGGSPPARGRIVLHVRAGRPDLAGPSRLR